MNLHPNAHPAGLSHEEAALDEDPYVACMGRIALSTMAEQATALINDELRRGTCPAVLLVSLARFDIQSHASLAAQVMTPEGVRKMAEAYREMLGTYEEHAALTLQGIAKVRR